MYKIISRVLDGRKVIGYQLIDQHSPGIVKEFDCAKVKKLAANEEIVNARYNKASNGLCGAAGTNLRKVPSIQYYELVSQRKAETDRKFEQMSAEESIQYFLDNLKSQMQINGLGDLDIEQLDCSSSESVTSELYFVDLKTTLEPGMSAYNYEQCIKERKTTGKDSVELGIMIECYYKNMSNASDNIQVNIQIQTKRLMIPIDASNDRLKYSLNDAKHADTDRVSQAIQTMVAMIRSKKKIRTSSKRKISNV